MTGTLIFLDTETTSLRPDRRAWEIGAYVRRPGDEEVLPLRFHRFIFADCLDLGNADLNSLNIGGYWDRHPEGRGDMLMPPGSALVHESDALAEFAALSRGAYLVGSVTDFDADVLGTRMREHGILPAWQYRLVEVKNLAVGWLAHEAITTGTSHALSLIEPPWDPEELSKALGVDPGGYERHTALGDAKWAMDMYDKVMGNRVPYQGG